MLLFGALLYPIYHRIYKSLVRTAIKISRVWVESEHNEGGEACGLYAFPLVPRWPPCLYPFDDLCTNLFLGKVYAIYSDICVLSIENDTFLK